MAKVNSKKTANGSALDFEAQLWAVADWHTIKAKAKSPEIPPLAEQTRIVAEVEPRLIVVEQLKTVVSANLQRATRLRQSILNKTFTRILA